jgi:hypothetical protein
MPSGRTIATGATGPMIVHIAIGIEVVIVIGGGIAIEIETEIEIVIVGVIGTRAVGKNDP